MKAEMFLGWMAGGTGIVLLYSAYKNKSPLTVLTDTLTGNKTTAAPISGFVSTTPTTGTTVTGSTRASAIKAKTVRPDYVSIGSQPNLVLDRDAAASFARVEAAYGKTIFLSGASRSYAEQAASYALHPERFAPPGTSLHEVGLAVDVVQTMNLEDPRLIAAFTSNGWFRAGKLGNWYGHGQIHEPWHWSYGVAG